MRRERTKRAQNRQHARAVIERALDQHALDGLVEEDDRLEAMAMRERTEALLDPKTRADLRELAQLHIIGNRELLDGLVRRYVLTSMNDAFEEYRTYLLLMAHHDLTAMHEHEPSPNAEWLDGICQALIRLDLDNSPTYGVLDGVFGLLRREIEQPYKRATYLLVCASVYVELDVPEVADLLWQAAGIAMDEDKRRPTWARGARGR